MVQRSARGLIFLQKSCVEKMHRRFRDPKPSEMWPTGPEFVRECLPFGLPISFAVTVAYDYSTGGRYFTGKGIGRRADVPAAA